MSSHSEIRISYYHDYSIHLKTLQGDQIRIKPIFFLILINYSEPLEKSMEIIHKYLPVRQPTGFLLAVISNLQ